MSVVDQKHEMKITVRFLLIFFSKYRNFKRCNFSLTLSIFYWNTYAENRKTNLTFCNKTIWYIAANLSIPINRSLLNDVFKLTLLWTTGSWSLCYMCVVFPAVLLSFAPSCSIHCLSQNCLDHAKWYLSSVYTYIYNSRAYHVLQPLSGCCLWW